MSGEGRRGRSTPSSWDENLLTEKETQWTRLDSRYRACICQIEKLHQAGQGNSAECIKLTLRRNDTQEKIELLEDEIYRTGPCPKQQCLLHQRETEVRSTRISNEKFEVISPKKAAKIRKINSTPEIQLENKFEQLMEVDKQNDQAEVKKSENDIPAVNLLMDSNYNLTLQEIANKFPKTTNKLVKGFISITADTEENINNIINYLNETNKECVLSEKREDRPLKIIIKGLPTDHSKELIQQDLENQNFKVIRISQLRNFKLKSFHPIFLIEIAKKGNYTNIFNLKSINHLSVKIENYHKKNKATICFKCSRFFHCARNCMCQARCIKCSKNHETRNCDIKTRIESPKCIDCLETGHLASWRGCPKFRNITRNNNRQTYAQKVKHTPNSDPLSPHRKHIEIKEPTSQDMNEVSDLLNAIKIIKDTLKEFPNILEISKQLKHCKDKIDLIFYFKFLIKKCSSCKF
ncbi:hypothetical protein AVEN_215732-1 [Araneus ventricosus]|uniref:Pre-C2HC domain-containing protein n=1 Tax=Araneus ventricosus TaxID=182803 RepID=A0A4Y2FM76_ARAVE|nr:hypothetical protein AVEN_215732-1 [Araneus ventricosus]